MYLLKWLCRITTCIDVVANTIHVAEVNKSYDAHDVDDERFDKYNDQGHCVAQL